MPARSPDASEAMTMVAVQVFGNDARSDLRLAGHFELNVFKPL